MLEELLDHVISEDILHELNSVWFDFSEHLVFLIAVCSLELLLDKARAMLVSAKFNNMVVDILVQNQLYDTEVVARKQDSPSVRSAC